MMKRLLEVIRNRAAYQNQAGNADRLDHRRKELLTWFRLGSDFRKQIDVVLGADKANKAQDVRNLFLSVPNGRLKILLRAIEDNRVFARRYLAMADDGKVFGCLMYFLFEIKSTHELCYFRYPTTVLHDPVDALDTACRVLRYFDYQELSLDTIRHILVDVIQNAVHSHCA